MRVPRIYHPDQLSAGQRIELTTDAFQHCVKVLRMGSGDAIELFNGDGHNYSARLTEVAKRNASAEILSSQANSAESPLAVHLGQVISRGDRMDFVLQKSVELGVTEITPLFSERCGVKLSGERLEKKQKQWQKIVVSACEQCGRSVVPTVNPPQTLQQFVEQPTDALNLTLDPTADIPLRQLAERHSKTSSVRLLIGPEGGFTEQEVELSAEQSFKPIRLGPRILRTETAALTALSVIQYELGDLA